MTLQSLVRHRIRQHLESLPARPTQAALAEAIGMTQSWLSHYLSGRHSLDLDLLEKLCGVLQIDVASVVRADGDIHTTMPADLSEPLALLRTLPSDTRDTVIALLRELTRPKTQKRARPKRR